MKLKLFSNRTTDSGRHRSEPYVERWEYIETGQHSCERLDELEDDELDLGVHDLLRKESSTITPSSDEIGRSPVQQKTLSGVVIIAPESRNDLVPEIVGQMHIDRTRNFHPRQNRYTDAGDDLFLGVPDLPAEEVVSGQIKAQHHQRERGLRARWSEQRVDKVPGSSDYDPRSSRKRFARIWQSFPVKKPRLGRSSGHRRTQTITDDDLVE